MTVRRTRSREEAAPAGPSGEPIHSERPATVIKALLHEREGYVVKGQADRVVQVDEQLAYWRSR
jgi:hypothetical protein